MPPPSPPPLPPPSPQPPPRPPPPPPYVPVYVLGTAGLQASLNATNTDAFQGVLQDWLAAMGFNYYINTQIDLVQSTKCI